MKTKKNRRSKVLDEIISEGLEMEKHPEKYKTYNDIQELLSDLHKNA